MLQIRAVSLKGYLDVANFVGIDGLVQLAEVGISPSDLNDPERRLPAGVAVELLERSAAASGCQHFGILMAQSRSFGSLGPVSLLFQHLATVGDVVTALRAFRRTMSDVLFVELDKSDDTALMTFDLVQPFSRPQATDLTVGLGLIALRGASNGLWSPEVVHFTHGRPANVRPFEEFFRARLQFDSIFNGFASRIASLGTPLPLADSTMAHNASLLLRRQNFPDDDRFLSDRVRQSVVLLLPSGRATLQRVAANIGLSARSLQRLLEKEQQTFGSLLDEVRGERAQHYLADSRMSVTEIAEQLGYATPTSFARWFNAKFGASPRSWRSSQKVTPAAPSRV